MIALIGAGILVATGLLFWRALPRDGKVHAVVGTAAEPYFAIVFVTGIAFGIGLMVVEAARQL